MIFNRVWAMPSRHTFTIKPIEELLKRYVINSHTWVDPFAGWHSPAGCTNDLNPEAPTIRHMPAIDFVNSCSEIPNLLFDPPYSPRQISECYKAIGRPVGIKDTQNALLYSSVRDAAAPKIPAGGCVISCGWNSAGMGLNRGFDLIEVLMVPHGAAHNDTIVTVEIKR